MTALVQAYTPFWSYDSDPDREGYGGVLLKLEETSNARLRTRSPHVLQIWVDMLRNESPVFFDKERGILRTALENVGEGEADFE
ncbi:MAG: hypothetical protein AAFR87_29050 [Bacteroidota bacterium]